MRDSENKMVAEKTTNQHIKINRAEVKGNSIVYFCQNADDMGRRQDGVYLNLIGSHQGD